jgi:sugar fermentation stimulation protein A
MLLPELYPGLLVRRYKRFLADIELPDGTTVTVHCPNSGSMLGCCAPGSPVLLSRNGNPGRTYPHTWELVQVNGVWAGINTARPNHLVREAIETGTVTELRGYDAIRPEVPYGTGSRIDLLLTGSAGTCYVEVKNVTLVEGRRALFPDSVTTRGQKHLRELMAVVRSGHRGVIFFLVQREDGDLVAPADRIDPEYGRLLRKAADAGVDLLAYGASVRPDRIDVVRSLPVFLP